jgi:hypothetical protein
MVPISVQGPNGQIVSTWALADTGADSTAFPLKDAEDFGIKLKTDCAKEKGMSADGPDSEQWIYRSGLPAQIEDVQFQLLATFMDTPVILLGQEDFFMRFHVSFDRREQKVTLRPY